MTDSPARPRATCWRLRTRTLEIGSVPLVMGIVNTTPDSFSDGGRYFDASAAVEHGLRLAHEGADILDIGGESTRPYADPVDVREELRRTIEVVGRLRDQTSLPISIDTSKAEVARRAVEAGAEIINDVTGLQGDAAMESVAVESGAGVCVMHMQGNPRTMQDRPSYSDVVTEVAQYLRSRRDTLIERGVAPAKICLDPGIGFGKKTQHNVALLCGCQSLLQLGAPLLVGHSRKGFLGKLIQDDDADRLPAGLAVSLWLAERGVHVLRVHDVRPLRDALRVQVRLADGSREA